MDVDRVADRANQLIRDRRVSIEGECMMPNQTEREARAWVDQHHARPDFVVSAEDVQMAIDRRCGEEMGVDEAALAAIECHVESLMADSFAGRDTGSACAMAVLLD